MRYSEKNKHATRLHQKLSRKSRKYWKAQIDNKKYPICVFCGEPITQYATKLGDQNPENLSMEFNINGKIFAECYYAGDLDGKNFLDLHQYCFPAHLRCNLNDNQDNIQKRTKKMINSETELVKTMLEKHTPLFVLGYLTAMSEVNPCNGIDYNYCIEHLLKITKNG